MNNTVLIHFVHAGMIGIVLFFVQCLALYAQEPLSETTATSKATSRSGWRILPIPSYAPETSLALTCGGLYFFPQTAEDSTGRLNQIFGGIQYTLRNQFVVSILPEMYFNNENIRLFGQVEVSRYPDFFYGVGSNLPESNREPFTIFRIAAIGSLWFSINGKGIRNGLNAGIRFDYDYQNVIERQTDGILERHGVDSVVGRNGGLLAGLGLTLNYDSRDITIAPRYGEFVEVRVLPYAQLLGSTFEGWRTTVDIRKYWSLSQSVPESEGFSHTLAVQLYGDVMTGNIPFFRLGLFGNNVGGNALARGYYGGRFRDRALGVIQVEYRFPIFWRFGGVVFAGTGNVAPSVATFDITTLKHNVGAGLRFALVPEERINLRIDVGYGFATKTLFPYISFTEAF